MPPPSIDISDTVSASMPTTLSNLPQLLESGEFELRRQNEEFSTRLKAKEEELEYLLQQFCELKDKENDYLAEIETLRRQLDLIKREEMQPKQNVCVSEDEYVKLLIQKEKANEALMREVNCELVLL